MILSGITMKNALKEARIILKRNRYLLLKYPDKFSLRFRVKMWTNIVANLEKEKRKQ